MTHNLGSDSLRSPTAGHRMFHTRGEKASAAVAMDKGLLFGLSSGDHLSR